MTSLEEALQLVQATDERSTEAELHRLYGDEEIGDKNGAEIRYLQARAVAERQNARTHALLAVTSLARLRRDHGKRDEARDLLAPVYNWFTEGFDTPVLKEAKSLLEQLTA